MTEIYISVLLFDEINLLQIVMYEQFLLV